MTSNVPYTIGESDRGEYIYLVRSINWRDNDGDLRTQAPGQRPDRPGNECAAAATPLTPTPTPTHPVPTVAPTPAPTFDVPATPVGTNAPILTDTPSQRRAIRPFPIVRMRGRLTSNGARVTLLTVRAPRAATVTVRCKGSCPTSRWSPTERKKKLTRARSFERRLKSGTRISVTVSRNGYIGKRTVFVIRKGRAPSRVDNCLNSRGRVTRCPAGV